MLTPDKKPTQTPSVKPACPLSPPSAPQTGISADTLTAAPPSLSTEIARSPHTTPASAVTSTTACSENQEKRYSDTIKAAASSVCSGVGQIMFGHRPVTGAAFLVGIALASPVLAIGSMVGSCIGSLTALAMRCDRSEIKQGIFGFNASLVGLAATISFGPSMAALGLMSAGCIASTAITLAMRKQSLLHYTAPFVVSTWTMWAIEKALELAPNPQLISQIPNLSTDPFGAFHGIGQVLFQESAAIGLIFTAGLFLSSPKAAVAGILASLSAGVCATALGFSNAAVASGLLGYNAALCAIALKDKPIRAIGATIATIPLYAAFGYVELPALTAPFVLATWLASGMSSKGEPTPD